MFGTTSSNHLRTVRRSTLTLLSALFVFMATSCNKNSPRELHFAQLPITYSAVTFLAEQQGYYREAGLNYSSISLPAGPDVVTALKATTGTIATAGGIAITPVVTMIGAGDSPVIVATTLRSNTQTKLVTFQSTGITASASTLKGRKIGVTKNTNGDVYLYRLLSKGALKESDVIVTAARPADLVGLLLRGDIDAAVLWDPYVVQTLREYRKRLAGGAKSRGEAVVLVDPTLYTLAFNIVTTRGKLLSDRDGLGRMLQATLRAEGYIRDHRQEAQESLERWLRVEPGDLDDFFATTDFSVRLDTPQVRQWLGEELNWLHSVRPDAAMPTDLSQFIDASVLGSIDRDRVRQ